MDNWSPSFKWLGDVLSLTTILGAFMGSLPAVAAVIGILYYFVQLYESHTVQRWLRTRRERKIAALKVKLAAYAAQSEKRDADPARDDKALGNGHGKHR